MKLPWSLIAPVAGALVLIAGSAIYEGEWTDRWGPHTTQRLEEFMAGIERAPAMVGNTSTGIWEGSGNNPESNERIRAVTGAVSELSRTYLNPRFPSAGVTVYLICGPSRNVSVHTPDACYPGAGFTMEGKPQKFAIGYSKQDGGASSKETAEFATAVFSKKDGTGRQRVRLFWAWNAAGSWEAPDYPRMRYGGRQPLNKLYLICPASSDQAPGDSPSVDFAQLFLPRIDELLFPASQEP